MTSNVVVLVPGIIGWSWFPNYWDTANSEFTNKCGLQLLMSSISSVSSHHDRACQLFAQILGKVVDYGKEHSMHFKHRRYGKDYSVDDQGLFPEWSASSPVHLLCHSSGGNTARYLQYLLDVDFWNLNTSSMWIKSITCISSDLNGTTLPYSFDIDEVTGMASLEVWHGIFEKLWHVIRWGCKKIETSDMNKKLICKWDLSQWNIESAEKFPDVGCEDALHTFLSSNDHLLFDCTIQGANKINKFVKDYPSTYYFALVTKSTDLKSLQQISPSTNPFLMMPAGLILHNSFVNGCPIDDIEPDNEWRENDGVVPFKSQLHPRQSKSAAFWPETETFATNCWYFNTIQNLSNSVYPWDHIMMVFGREFLTPKFLRQTAEDQIKVYDTIFSVLSKL